MGFFSKPPKEHKKRRPSTEEKHTKARPGRMTEKKREHESWVQKKDKKK